MDRFPPERRAGNSLRRPGAKRLPLGANKFEKIGSAIPGKRGNGGAERNRTADLLIANEALSQLSYSPEPFFRPNYRTGEAGFVGMGPQPVKLPACGEAARLGTSSPMINPIAALLIQVLEIYKWIVIAAVIVSWLTAFNVINVSNNFVRSLLRILMALTEPVFRPIRKVIPPVGGLDLSPLIVFVIIWFLQYTITYVAVRYAF